jgi:hypothetical protein
VSLSGLQLSKIVFWVFARGLESAAMNTHATGTLLIGPIMKRLEDQIGWYDRKSLLNQRYFKRIKIVAITAAALIPFVSAFNFERMAWVSGGLGVVVVITVLEGMLHLNQYEPN